MVKYEVIIVLCFLWIINETNTKTFFPLAPIAVVSFAFFLYKGKDITESGTMLARMPIDTASKKTANSQIHFPKEGLKFANLRCLKSYEISIFLPLKAQK